MSVKNIVFVNITNNKFEYKEKVKKFLENLDSERKFFNLDLNRILNLEFIIIAMDGQELIGIAGLERKFSLVRSIMMISRKHQGKGLGTKFMVRLLDDARNNGYSIIMGVVEEKNIGALKMDYSTGYRFCGKRENLCYIFNPLNTKGMIYFRLIKLLFPLVRIVDYVRR